MRAGFRRLVYACREILQIFVAAAAAKKVAGNAAFPVVPCFFLAQVVGILEKEVPDLIEVPKALEHASTVGDHLNFHLVNPTEEENLAFQVVFCMLIY